MKNKEEESIHYITAEPDSFAEFFKKIYHYKPLIIVFAKRDLKVKYAQTLIGIGWTLFQPLIAIAIYTFFFGYLLNWKTDDLPFPLYVLSGLLGWNFFAYIVNNGVNSLMESSSIIKKIYFPKSILALSKVGVALVELVFPLLLLIPMILYYGKPLLWTIVFIPLILFYNIICALCIVFWFSIFSYVKRDLLHVLPFILQFGIWFAPVFFSTSLLPDRLAIIMNFNPMANVVQLWRWSLFGDGQFHFLWLLNMVLVTLLTLLGMYFYNQRESQFVDFV